MWATQFSRSFGDTTQLDAAYQRVGAEVPAKLAPASAALEQFGNDWTVSGTSAATAAAQMAQGAASVRQELDATGENVAFAGSQFQELGEKATTNLREAKGTAMLLNNELNLGLNRHLVGYLARLPGVGAALEAAFSATAVLFLIQALVQGLDKLYEWSLFGERISEAWGKVDAVQSKVFESLEDDLLKAQIKTAELTGNHLEALRLKLLQIDNVSLSKLAGEIAKIAAEADKAFKDVTPNFIQKLYGFEAVEEVKTKFQEISKTVEDALSPRTPQAYDHALRILDDTLHDIQLKMNDLATKEKKPIVVGGFIAPTVDPHALESWDALHVKLEQIKQDIKESQAAEQQDKGNVRLEEQKKAADAAHKALEEQLKVMAAIGRAQAELGREVEKQNQQQEKQVDLRLKNELKAEETAAKEKLELLKQKEQAAIAVIDGEIQAQQEASEQGELLLKTAYDEQLITGRQYVQRLRELYAADVSAQLDALNRKKQLVILEAQIEAAERGKILSAEDAKELKQVQELENKKFKIIADFDKRLLKAEDQVDKKLTAIRSWQAFFHAIVTGALTAGEAMHKFGQLMTEAIGASVAAAVMGSEGFGQAMEKMLKSALAELAGEATVKALKELAEAAAAAATPGGQMWVGPHLAAAAKWAAVAAAAGAAGAAIPSGGGGHGGAGTDRISPSIDKAAAATQPEQQPVQTTNVQHFQYGGLMTKPQLAVVGDVREAIVPLGSDRRAVNEIADAIAGRLELHGGGGTIHNYNWHLDVQGIISPDNLTRVMRRMSQQVNKGQSRLLASNSIRITRRS